MIDSLNPDSNIDLIKAVLCGQEVHDIEKKINHDNDNFARWNSYHYSFTNLKRSSLSTAQFEKVGERTTNQVTIYLIPHKMNLGGIWLKKTQNEKTTQVSYTLTCVFVVSKDHIVIGQYSRKNPGELIQYLNKIGFDDLCSIEELEQHSYTTQKQIFKRKDGVECQICVSEMDKYIYYQHATLKFNSTCFDQPLSSVMAEDLRQQFNFQKGRSSVLECLRLDFPEAYKLIKQVDYEGDVLDCYSGFNYFDHDEEEDEEEIEHEFPPSKITWSLEVTINELIKKMNTHMNSKKSENQ